MRKRSLVVIGFLGTTLDVGKRAERWDRWRPTVSLFQHEDLLIDRIELLCPPAPRDLAETVSADIRKLSPDTKISLQTFGVADPWDFETMYGALHDFARSYPFDVEREDYLVHITTGTHVAQICLFLLAESRHIPARLIQTAPAKRHERDSSGSYAIIDLDLSKYDRLAQRFRREQTDARAVLKSGIDTKNAKFNHLIEQIERVAISSRAPMLLMGPTGAGKSLLARKIFELKKSRRQVAGEFIEVNCATLRGDGAMSTLFGHVKGAFTGALADRTGLLRKADGGVLFLDEIGELGRDEQAILLRAVEEKVFYPMGSDRMVKSDFQLIAGTNRDLAVEAARGAFREDLLARIDLWSFTLPALRERTEDIPANLDYELAKASDNEGVRFTFSREARDRFVSFASSPAARWPGNFRDFNAAVTRLATLSDGGRITTPVVEEEIARLRSAWTGGRRKSERDLVGEIMGARAGELDRFDRVQLEDVLAVCREETTLSAAGRVLFAQSLAQRTSSNDADRLRKYLARFGLSWSDVK